MKKILFAILIALTTVFAFGQTPTAKSVKFIPLQENPTSPENGQLFYKQTDSLFYYYDGIQFKSFGEGSVGSGKGILNAYFVSSSGGDLEAAITAVETLNASEGKLRFLVIDQDVTITGTPRTITIPEEIPVLIQNGFKIITPNVDRDITGVADTYNAIELNGVNGTAEIQVGDTAYPLTFNASLTQTATDFVTNHAANILANQGLTVTSTAETIEFNGARSGFGDNFSITSLSMDLDGALAGYSFTLNSITGTVADNYMQLQIDGQFYADKYLQCFEGDGLIWFGKHSVDEIHASWWGLEGRVKNGAQPQDVIDLNVKAFQQAANCIVLDKLDRATSKLKLPNGKIYLDKPIIFYACNLDEHPYLTGAKATGDAAATVVQLEGAEKIKHGVGFNQVSKIYYQANWGNALVFQGLRNTVIKNIDFEGQNNVTARDSEWLPDGFNAGGSQVQKIALRPDAFETYDIEQIAWIKREIVWGFKRPYSAIVTDPFKVQYQFSKITTEYNAESEFDLYLQETTPAHQNSWGVHLENLHCSKFVEFICMGLQGQQGDTFVFKNIMWEGQPIGISVAQDQARDCKVYEVMSYGNVWAAFETGLHGDGIMPEVVSFHSAGGLKYVHFGGSLDGISNFSNMYIESVFGFGETIYRNGWYSGFALGDDETYRTGSNFGANITNSTLKSGGGNTFETTEGTGYLHRPPTIRGFNIYNSSFNGYDNQPKSSNIWLFGECNFYGVSLGENRAFYHPIDEGWFNGKPFSSLSRNMKVGGGTNDLGYPSSTPSFTETGISPNGTGKYDLTESISRTVEDMMAYQTMNTQSSTVTMYRDRLVMHVAKDRDTRLLEVGDIVSVVKSSTRAMAVVIANDGTTFELAKFSKFEWTELLTYVDGSNQMTGVNVYKIFFTKSFRPFCADLTGGSNTITVVSDARILGGQVGFQQTEKGDFFVLPDGRRYYVLDYTGSTIELDRNYQGSTQSAVWVDPERISFRAIGFIDNQTSGGNYYKKGQKLDYYSSTSLKGTGYVICIKTGTWQTQNSAYNADFIKYDDDDKIIEFLDGSTNTTVTFNTTGLTADRPDNAGFPTDYIPSGFIYNNTETVTNQIWTGTAFIDL